MISRNAKYVKAKRESGLTQITVWIPELVAPDFKLAASLCCSNLDLTVSQLRNIKTGRFMSIQAPVTCDTGGAE